MAKKNIYAQRTAKDGTTINGKTLFDTRDDRMKFSDWVVVDEKKRKQNPFKWRDYTLKYGTYRECIKYMRGNK